MYHPSLFSSSVIFPAVGWSNQTRETGPSSNGTGEKGPHSWTVPACFLAQPAPGHRTIGRIQWTPCLDIMWIQKCSAAQEHNHLSPVDSTRGTFKKWQQCSTSYREFSSHFHGKGPAKEEQWPVERCRSGDRRWTMNMRSITSPALDGLIYSHPA